VLIDAVVAIEDRRFFEHDGVDLWGTGRALWSNWQAGTVVAGGSTLTQQLAKNLFLSPEQSWERKSREMLIAIAIEDTLSKEEILAYYLNRVYFGSGA
ncbi:MAG: transglycosylase domain-containing protein, partial [Synechococcaceae cyanobacterium SM2_3_60]|nr:transglycosylase domain-containing protein [Synechococcaceae cyanobacterium SM2_3_60]